MCVMLTFYTRYGGSIKRVCPSLGILGLKANLMIEIMTNLFHNIKSIGKRAKLSFIHT